MSNELMQKLLRVPKLYENPKTQARYAANRAAHVAEVGALVDAVASLSGGGHSLLCFAPHEDGKGNYACTCGERKFKVARMIIEMVQSQTTSSQDQGEKK